MISFIFFLRSGTSSQFHTSLEFWDCHLSFDTADLRQWITQIQWMSSPLAASGPFSWKRWRQVEKAPSARCVRFTCHTSGSHGRISDLDIPTHSDLRCLHLAPLEFCEPHLSRYRWRSRAGQQRIWSARGPRTSESHQKSMTSNWAAKSVDWKFPTMVESSNIIKPLLETYINH